MKTPWFSLLNRGPARPVEILIYDEIGGFGVSAAELINQINAIASQPIILRINSPGGSVFDGYAIYNALAKHTAGVEVEIEGIAASIASYIAMAGKPVRMAENALLMIHNPTAFVGGEADDMERAAEMLTKCKDSILAAYKSKTNLPESELSDMMDKETWLSASESKAKGFVDEISAPMKAAALFDTKNFRNAPASIRTPMKIISASIAAILATASGIAIKEDSTEAEVQNAITGLVKKSDLDAINNKLTTLTTERDNLQQQYTALTETANKTKTDLTEANNKVTKLTTDLTDMTNKFETEKKHVGRLESLCQLRGVDPKQAIDPGSIPEGKVSRSALELEMSQAKTPQQKQAVLNKLKDAAEKKLLVA